MTSSQEPTQLPSLPPTDGGDNQSPSVPPTDSGSSEQLPAVEYFEEPGGILIDRDNALYSQEVFTQNV